VTALACFKSVLQLTRSSADFMVELRDLIVADARVAVADILSIHCGVVELTDRFDVDALVSGDVLVVRLRTAPKPPVLAAPPAAAVQVSGHKRGAEDPTAAMGSAPAESETGDSQAAKRSKPSGDKKW